MEINTIGEAVLLVIECIGWATLAGLLMGWFLGVTIKVAGWMVE